mmetsp:Transcript_57304/g.134570  ORF Transcript_57304/g.134570 Transcript_57304/m.134570 type:complete len:212 (-) Transcript_57304:1730-2365(-)
MSHLEDIRQEIQRQRVFNRLKELKKDIKETLTDCHEALENTSGLLVDYFRRIPESELSEQIRLRFNSWDTDKSGALDRDELTEAMAELGKRPTKEDMDNFMSEFDLDGSGTIELDEFEHMVRVHLCISTKNCKCQLCVAYREELAAAEGSVMDEKSTTSVSLNNLNKSTVTNVNSSVNSTPRDPPARAASAAAKRPGTKPEAEEKLERFKF